MLQRLTVLNARLAKGYVIWMQTTRMVNKHEKFSYGNKALGNMSVCLLGQY